MPPPKSISPEAGAGSSARRPALAIGLNAACEPDGANILAQESWRLQRQREWGPEYNHKRQAWARQWAEPRRAPDSLGQYWIRS